MSGIIGYTSPKFIARDSNPIETVNEGKSYFVVKIHSAQADFCGPIWDKVQGLVVTSSVCLNHAVLGSEPIRALQFSRKVKKGTAEKLGTSKNLINFVPAVMNRVSISIDFILDIHNRMADLSGLINAGAFVASVSLGPGAAVTAKTVSEISQKLITTFIPDPNEQRPILQFTGDFNIPAKELRDGYYVILGTRDPKKPLPSESAKMEVKDDGLYINGEPVTDLSYVILSVFSKGARTRDLNEGASWDRKLRDAELIADMASNPFTSEENKKTSYFKCEDLIKEAATLLNNDDNYLRDEARIIYNNALIDCRKRIFGEDTRLTKASRSSDTKGLPPTLELIDIKPNEDLAGMINRYKHEAAKTKLIIEKEKLLQ